MSSINQYHPQPQCPTSNVPELLDVPESCLGSDRVDWYLVGNMKFESGASKATTHEALACGKQDETRKYIHNKRQAFPGSR